MSVSAAIDMNSGSFEDGSGSCLGIDKFWNLIPALSSRTITAVSVTFVSEEDVCGVDDEVDVRTPDEHLMNIKNTLKPAISDLSGLFGVSRQSIYKWMSKKAIPDDRYLEKIRVLSEFSDRCQENGLLRSGFLLNVKAFDGCSYLDLLKRNEHTSEHADRLIQEALKIEQSRKDSISTRRKGIATEDWSSSIAIPGCWSNRV